MRDGAGAGMGTCAHAEHRESHCSTHTCWLMMLMKGRLTILASCSRREWWQAASVTCQQASPQPKQAAEEGAASVWWGAAVSTQQSWQAASTCACTHQHPRVTWPHPLCVELAGGQWQRPVGLAGKFDEGQRVEGLQLHHHLPTRPRQVCSAVNAVLGRCCRHRARRCLHCVGLRFPQEKLLQQDCTPAARCHTQGWLSTLCFCVRPPNATNVMTMRPL